MCIRDSQYTFGGTEYRYEALNNRWLAQAAGGATVVVSQDRPDPAAGTPGDLWWYCGDTGEDPGLFTIVADTTGNQQWVQSSPSALLAGSTSGGGGSGLTSGFPISPPDSTGSFTFTGGGLTGTGMGQVLYGHIVPGSNIGSVGITTNTTGTAWVQSGTTRDQSVASSASFIAFIGLDDVIACSNNGFEANYAAWDVVEDTSGSSTTVNIGGGGGGDDPISRTDFLIANNDPFPFFTRSGVQTQGPSGTGTFTWVTQSSSVNVYQGMS